MLIDWFTVVAQIVNFLILIWLLRRFLYGPILKAMDEREARVVGRLTEAGRKQAESEALAREYELRNREMDEQRGRLMDQARDAAEAQRQELMRQAKEEADQIRVRWLEAVARERDAFLHDVSRRVGLAVVDATRGMLERMADAELEASLVTSFVRGLEARDGEKARNLRASLDGQAVVLRSGFQLSAVQKGEIQDVVTRVLGSVDMDFVVDPEIIAGLSLVSGGHEYSLTIVDQLDGLRRDLEASFDTLTVKASHA